MNGRWIIIIHISPNLVTIIISIMFIFSMKILCNIYVNNEKCVCEEKECEVADEEKIRIICGVRK